MRPSSCSRLDYVLAAVASLLLFVAQATASSLDLVCAAPSCLFKNGSSCDRMASECPRCVRFDPLLNASICTNLQSKGTACAPAYTLCPETPLEASTGDADQNDKYEWVQLGSAVSDSSSDDSSGSAGCVTIPEAATTPSVPRTESTARPPKSAIAADAAAPRPSEAASRQTESSGSPPMLPPWLIITLAVVVALAAVLLVAALYVQRRRHDAQDDSMTPVPPPLSSVGEDVPYGDHAKDQFSPNSYGFGYELSSMRSNDQRFVSSRSLGTSSPTSTRNDTNDSAVPTSFAHRMDTVPTTVQSFPAMRHTHSTILGLSRTAVQSLPPLQPRTRTPGWTSSPPPPPLSPVRFAQYSFPRFTGDARVTMASAAAAAVSRSWTTNEFELMDDASSNASASCDDEIDDVFLTDNSGASTFAECDYVDTQTPGQASMGTGGAFNPEKHDAVDIYPDTSMTTHTESGRMFSPLSMRTRDTAARMGDVIAEWASLRGDPTPDAAKHAQPHREKIARWKAKFYQEL